VREIAFFMYSPPPGVVLSNNMVPNLFPKDIVRHLVGEASQNAIDAALSQRGGARARIRFRLIEVEVERLEKYGIREAVRHASACTEHDIAGEVKGPTVRVLCFEDWSGGLDGDVKGAERGNPLGRFVLTVGTGIDGKGGKANGRHGIGSGTGAMTSRMRCMYVYSLRQDGSHVATARLSLASRTVDGQAYEPEARLGVLEDGTWSGIPEGDEAIAIGNVFGFSRSGEDAGLCCAIIDPKPEATWQAIVANILGYQFYQVLQGSIEFEVIDETSGDEAFISAETFDSFLASEKFAAIREGLRKPGARSQLQQILDDLPEIAEFVRSYPGTAALPMADADNPVPEGARQAWHERRAFGRATLVSATHMSGRTAHGAIGTWMRQATGRKTGYDILVRDSITVVRTVNGRFSMTVARDDEIAEMLGDSEDPSHTKFLEPEAKKRGWKDCADVLRSFRDAGDRLHAAVCGSDDGIDRFSMARFFPMPGNDLASEVKGGSEMERQVEDGVVIVDGESGVSRILEFKVDRKTGSVVGRLGAEARAACAAGEAISVVIVAEYAGMKSGHGSFVDTQTNFIVEGAAQKVVIDGNEVTVFGASPDLRVVIRDVDRNRDLDIWHERIDEEAEAA